MKNDYCQWYKKTTFVQTPDDHLVFLTVTHIHFLNSGNTHGEFLHTFSIFASDICPFAKMLCYAKVYCAKTSLYTQH